MGGVGCDTTVEASETAAGRGGGGQAGRHEDERATGRGISASIEVAPVDWVGTGRSEAVNK